MRGDYAVIVYLRSVVCVNIETLIRPVCTFPLSVMHIRELFENISWIVRNVGGS